MGNWVESRVEGSDLKIECDISRKMGSTSS